MKVALRSTKDEEKLSRLAYQPLFYMNQDYELTAAQLEDVSQKYYELKEEVNDQGRLHPK